MPYTITRYTRKKALRHGVTVKLAKNPKKKLDVFRKGIKVAEIGGTGYKDYPTYIQSHGKTYAKERRRLYRIRHAKDRTRKNTAGYYSDVLLW